MLKKFFTPQREFAPHEWQLHYKVISILVMSFVIGIYTALFGIYRIYHGYTAVGSLELFMGIIFMISFISLRANIRHYMFFSKVFFVLLYMLMIILFIYVPDEVTSMLWTSAALIIIFFLLDYKGGILFFAFLVLFIITLMFFDANYKMTDYINWIASLSAVSWVMFFYEKLKEKEKNSLLDNTARLQEEVDKQTQKLQTLNNSLEERVQEELTHRQEQEQMFLHQSRLAGMGEMIDSIAHQWRQPLMNINAILMNMDRAMETKDRPPAYMHEKMDEVIVLTTHMSQTIEDFRSLFKEDKTKNTFYIHESISYALQLLESTLQYVDLRVTSTKNTSYYGYKNELIQVLMILLSNAVEILQTRNINTKTINIDIQGNEKYITLAIEDNAGGIEEAYLTQIFEPYFSTKKRTGGTGLGLYVAKIIIEQNMHGVLSVSNTNEGAKFEIKLPK
jgi:signal transduction histidine kinase